MVGLHVLDYEIVRLSAVQSSLEIVEPLMGKILINRIHDGDLVIFDNV